MCVSARILPEKPAPDMSGRVGDLSPRQAEGLHQFRERIEDILPGLPAQHDHYLLRWLREEAAEYKKEDSVKLCLKSL
ncbi:unnamed protein product [Menidia menidia]|uniref:(Atlantic silverside) hypothetical protein n=1 Tax=Menidia menidia TaxID=238744 RepID=A0A8S4AHY1_9TELE|nr:unnamed protein product [Menidia menidia]